MTRAIGRLIIKGWARIIGALFVAPSRSRHSIIVCGSHI
jgi:hypothetical protein